MKTPLSKIENRGAVIGVIGLGYVGLPLCREFVRGGAKVLGFDIDPKKVECIDVKKTYIEHIPDETIAEMVDSGLFSATTDLDRLNEPDAILIAVPTPAQQDARTGSFVCGRFVPRDFNPIAQRAISRAGIDHLPGDNA